MSKTINDSAAVQLYNLLLSRDFEIEILSAEGKPVSDPNEAELYTFDYRTEQKNYGTVVALLNSKESVELFFGDSLGRGMEREDREGWYEFLYQVRMFAKKKLLSFGLKNMSKLKYAMQGMAALHESYYGNKHQSFSDMPQNTRIKIKHSKPVEEGGQRFRNVESIYVETADGEVFKMPFNKIAGARAMAQHVANGGKPWDDFGSHITEMVTEISSLARYSRMAKRQVTSEDDSAEPSAALAHYSELKRALQSLSGRRGYTKYRETWSPLSQVDESKGKNYMKEIKLFESWAQRVTEGTSKLGTLEGQREFQELMSQPITVGPDGINASELLYDLVGDDELDSRLSELAQTDPEADARDTVVEWMQDNQFNNPDIAQALASLNSPGSENEVEESSNINESALSDWKKKAKERLGKDVVFKDEKTTDRYSEARVTAWVGDTMRGFFIKKTGRSFILESKPNMKGVEDQLSRHARRRIDYEQENGPMAAHEIVSHELQRKRLMKQLSRERYKANQSLKTEAADPAERARKQMAKLEAQIDTIKGRIGMARERRASAAQRGKGSGRIQSSAETRLMSKLDELNRQYYELKNQLSTTENFSGAIAETKRINRKTNMKNNMKQTRQSRQLEGIGDMVKRFKRGQEADRKSGEEWSKSVDAEKRGDKAAADKHFRKHTKYHNLTSPNQWTTVKEDDYEEDQQPKQPSVFAGGRKSKTITRRHVPLVWENMLATVYAKNPDTGEVKYFDYNYAAAHEFARVAQCSDLRVAKNPVKYANYPSRNQVALWGIPPANKAVGEGFADDLLAVAKKVSPGAKMHDPKAARDAEMKKRADREASGAQPVIAAHSGNKYPLDGRDEKSGRSYSESKARKPPLNYGNQASDNDLLEPPKWKDAVRCMKRATALAVEFNDPRREEFLMDIRFLLSETDTFHPVDTETALETMDYDELLDMFDDIGATVEEYYNNPYEHAPGYVKPREVTFNPEVATATYLKLAKSLAASKKPVTESVDDPINKLKTHVRRLLD